MTEPMPELYDVAAERIVLGSIMQAPAVADDVIEILTSADFYHPGHDALFARMVSHLATGEPVDPVALAHALEAADELKRVGGRLYLVKLLESVPTAASAPWYARVVADHAARRRLVEVAEGIKGRAYALGREASDVANYAQQAVLDATLPRQRIDAVPLRELVDAEVDNLLSDEGPRRGVSTGLGALDDVIGGLKPGQLVLAAGRPGSGKSILCVDFARSAVRRDVPTLLVSLEMHRTEILARIFAAQAGVNLYRLLNGGMDYAEKARVRASAEVLRPQPMHIDTTRPADIATVRSLARRLKGRKGLGLVVVDYLQLLTPVARRDSRVQELGEISRGLKLLAGDLDVPIVAAAQLNRSAESRRDYRPQLSDLRESGSLENDADIVILIHRPDYHDPEHARAGEVDLIVAKNRNGPMETVTAAAHLEFSRFVDFGV